MLRFLFVILISIPYIILYSAQGAYIEKHDIMYPTEKYTEEQRYVLAQKVIKVLKRNGRITTEIVGEENLPEEGGYVMYSNHQGKYDALGIMYGHKKPCTILMDLKRSKLPIVNPFVNLLKGCRLDKDSIESQVNVMRTITQEVKAGRRYLIFPEGGYNHNRNNVGEFMPGSFKCAVRAKAPIVPVAITDSYIPFEVNSLKKVTTKVCFLEPIQYEDYKGKTTQEISEMVRNEIIKNVG